MCDNQELVNEIKSDILHFFNEYNLTNYMDMTSALIDLLANTREINLSRGKREIWSGAVVVAIARVNFLFDKNRSNSIEMNDICVFFNTKKTSVGNKASMISQKLNIGLADSRFSDSEVLNSFKDVSDSAKKGMAAICTSLAGARNRALFHDMVDAFKL